MLKWRYFLVLSRSLSFQIVTISLLQAPFHSPFEGTINLSMTAKEAISSQPPSHKGFLVSLSFATI